MTTPTGRVRRWLSSFSQPTGGLPASIHINKRVDDVALMQQYETQFDGKPLELRFFLSDPILYRCVTAVSGYATLTVGFDTVLESPIPLTDEANAAFMAKYQYVKDYVDGVNKTVNADNAFYVAAIKMCLYGKAAFEIELDTNGRPVRLSVLPVYNNSREGLQPVIDEDTNRLIGYVIRGKKKDIEYKLFDVLYFVNNDLDGDYQGISDVQHVVPICINRAGLQRQTPMMLRRIHSPYVVASVDTSNNTFTPENMASQKEELQAQLKKLAEGIDSGSNVVTNNKVSIEMVQLKIDLPGTHEYDTRQEDKIIAHFGVPPFLVNRRDVNRATAETEFTAFVAGTVAVKQRYIKRVLESVWYDMLVRKALNLAEDAPLPVKVKHVWRKSDTGNIKEKAEAANTLYGNGLGLLGEYPELALKTVGLNEVAQCLTKPEPVKA